MVMATNRKRTSKWPSVHQTHWRSRETDFWRLTWEAAPIDVVFVWRRPFKRQVQKNSHRTSNHVDSANINHHSKRVLTTSARNSSGFLEDVHVSLAQIPQQSKVPRAVPRNVAEKWTNNIFVQRWRDQTWNKHILVLEVNQRTKNEQTNSLCTGQQIIQTWTKHTSFSEANGIFKKQKLQNSTKITPPEPKTCPFKGKKQT